PQPVTETGDSGSLTNHVTVALDVNQPLTSVPSIATLIAGGVVSGGALNTSGLVPAATSAPSLTPSSSVSGSLLLVPGRCSSGAGSPPASVSGLVLVGLVSWRCTPPACPPPSTMMTSRVWSPESVIGWVRGCSEASWNPTSSPSM